MQSGIELKVGQLNSSYVDIVRNLVAFESGLTVGRETYFKLLQCVNLRFEGRSAWSPTNNKKVAYFWSRIYPNIYTVAPSIPDAQFILDSAMSKKLSKPKKDNRTLNLFDANGGYEHDAKELQGEQTILDIWTACDLIPNDTHEVLCPFHDDTNASLGYFKHKIKGDYLLKCLACGWTGDIVKFIRELEGLTYREGVDRCFEILEGSDPVISDEITQRIVEHGEPKPKIPMKEVCSYVYYYEDGSTAFEVVRNEGFDEDGKKHKEFPLRHKVGKKYVWAAPLDGSNKLLLYKIPDVLKAEDIIFCEGEKDVATAERIFGDAFVATTNCGGARSLNREHVESLRNKNVWDCPDNDTAGQNRATDMDVFTKGIVKRLFRVTFPDGCKDLTEYAEKFGDAATVDLIMQAKLVN